MKVNTSLSMSCLNASLLTCNGLKLIIVVAVVHVHVGVADDQG